MVKLKPWQQGRVLCRTCGNEYKTPPRKTWRVLFGRAYTYCQYCKNWNFEEDVQAVEYRPAWK